MLTSRAAGPEVGGELGELSQVLQHVMRERRASQAAGEMLLVKMRAVMAKAPVGIAFTRNRRFELVSDEFNRLLGYEGSGLDGEAARLIYASDEFYQGLGTRVAATFAIGRVFAEEIEFVRRDGSRFWGQLMGAPVSQNDAGAGTIWSLGDISDERRRRNALSWAATHDALTNIANRHEFESQLAEHLRDRRRRESRACCTSISTASRRSTTPPATPPATSCCATSPRCCWRGSARSTWRHASAATSSRSFCTPARCRRR